MILPISSEEQGSVFLRFFRICVPGRLIYGTVLVFSFAVSDGFSGSFDSFPFTFF